MITNKEQTKLFNEWLVKNKQHQDVSVLDSLANSVVTDAGLQITGNGLEPFLYIPEIEQEESEYQVFQQAKKTIIKQMITNKPILLDFMVGIPKFNSNTKEGYYIKSNKMDKNVINALNTGKDAGLPNFLGNSSLTHTVAIADFDIIPEPFNSWQEFRETLARWFEGKAIITSSRNNKAKVWFFFTGTMTIEQKREFIKGQFEPLNLWNKKGLKINKEGKEVLEYCLDRNGISNSLITWDIIESIQASIKSINILSLSFNSIVEQEVKNTIQHKEISCFSSWKLFDGVMPEVFNTLSVRKQGILRIMASSLYASTNNVNGGGFALSQIELAKHFGVSQSMISRDIRELFLDGYIVKQTNYYYSSNNNQKSYAAKYVWSFSFMGWAKKELENIKNNNSSKKSLPEILSTFIDGNWNSALWELSGIISEPTAYLKQVKMIRGWDSGPERLKQALNALKCRKQYYKLIITYNERKA